MCLSPAWSTNSGATEKYFRSRFEFISASLRWWSSSSRPPYSERVSPIERLFRSIKVLTPVKVTPGIAGRPCSFFSRSSFRLRRLSLANRRRCIEVVSPSFFFFFFFLEAIVTKAERKVVKLAMIRAIQASMCNQKSCHTISSSLIR